MNKPQIHLFVQDGCRPCHYVKTRLSKVDGWKEVVTITDSKCCGEWTDFAKDSGVVATPTLVVFEDGEVIARQAGSQSFTAEFFEGLVDKFTAQKTTNPRNQMISNKEMAIASATTDVLRTKGIAAFQEFLGSKLFNSD